MAIKLNIRMFEGDGDDLAVNPGPWNSSCSDFESGARNFNNALENNEQVIAAMKEFMGSPMMIQALQPHLQALTNATEDADKYFKSVNAWSGDVMNSFNSYNCTSAPQSIHTGVSAQVMENVNETFDGSKIGLRTAADASNFVSQVEGVIQKLSSSLAEATSAADAARGSIPSMIHNAFSSTVQQTHDNIKRDHDLMNTLITDEVEKFRDALKNWAADAASAARGGN